MGWNDRINEEDEDRDEFLQQLIDDGYLEDAALGITKLVIDKGEDALSEKQKYVFQREVLDAYANRKCTRDGAWIPWSEKYEALSNGGLCSYCQHMSDKVRDEK